jgi:hypothetical protein
MTLATVTVSNYIYVWKLLIFARCLLVPNAPSARVWEDKGQNRAQGVV